MKARIPIMSNNDKKRLKAEIKLEIDKEWKKREEQLQVDFTRKIFKIFCRVLNENNGFGKGRCLDVINGVTDYLEKTRKDEVWLEHLDRYVIDYMGVPFERDYSD